MQQFTCSTSKSCYTMAVVSHCTAAAVYKPAGLLAIPQLDKSVSESTLQRRTLATRNINCYWQIKQPCM